MQIIEKDKIEANSIIITLIEGLGDIYACEPIARYLKKEYPDKKIYWATLHKYKEILWFNPNLDGIILVKSLASWTYFCTYLPKSIKIFNLHFHSTRDNISQKWVFNDNKKELNEFNYYNYGCLLETFCLTVGLPKISDAPIFYFDPNIKFPLINRKYVIFHTLSTEYSRNWNNKNWNKLAEYFFNKNIYVVEIGLKSVIKSNNPLYINMSRTLSLQEIALLIKNAIIFVGVDSAFAHIANAVNCFGIILIGKFKNFTNQMPYSGNYMKGINCTIIRNFYEDSTKIDIKFVLMAIEEFFNNQPINQKEFNEKIKKIQTKNVNIKYLGLKPILDRISDIRLNLRLKTIEMRENKKNCLTRKIYLLLVYLLSPIESIYLIKDLGINGLIKHFFSNYNIHY